MQTAVETNTMERTTVIIAERSPKRDLCYFLFGAWSVIVLQLLL